MIGYLLFSCLFHSVIAASNYACKGTNSIAAPSNLNDTINFPSSWDFSTSNNPPSYAKNQDCYWNITVPMGYYVWLNISAKTASSSKIRVVHSNGMIEDVPSTTSQEPFFLLAPSFGIHLEAKASGTLGFSVKYFPVPDVDPIKIRTTSSTITLVDYPFAAITFDWSYLSLLTSYPDPNVPNSISLMRGLLVFNGIHMNSTFVGNLYQLLMSHNHTTIDNLSIYNPQVLELGNVIVVQDASNVDNYYQYQLASCGSETCSFDMDASQGDSALLLISETPQYLTDVSISSSAYLDVRVGEDIDSDTIITYDSTSRKSAFPQKLTSSFTHFVLDTDYGTVKITNSTILGAWTTSSNGRTGYIVSSTIDEQISSNQDVVEIFEGDRSFSYTTHIKQHGLIGDATLQITTFDAAHNAIENHVYTADNLPRRRKEVQKGKTLSVTYHTNGEQTDGVLSNFQSQKVQNQQWSMSVLLCYFSKI